MYTAEVCSFAILKVHFALLVTENKKSTTKFPSDSHMNSRDVFVVFLVKDPLGSPISPVTACSLQVLPSLYYGTEIRIENAFS